MVNSRVFTDVNDFAKTIFEMLKSDRDVNCGVGGFTGEGKTRFSVCLEQAYAKISGDPWSYRRLTWSRKELLLWIDGDIKKPINKKNGLREGQLPEYSAILPDELFDMFYRRNWFDDEQIDAIGTFNKCRDRHLLLCGNVPNFWDLDSAFTNRIRFYIYIPYRGVAWIFEQENNPFSNDPWNLSENKKLFRKHHNPYKIANFVCEIHYPDWTPEEKKEYYHLRNTKRVSSINENKTEREERYAAIKNQRDILIKLVFQLDPKLTNKDVSQMLDMSQELVRLVRLGER